MNGWEFELSNLQEDLVQGRGHSVNESLRSMVSHTFLRAIY